MLDSPGRMTEAIGLSSKPTTDTSWPGRPARGDAVLGTSDQAFHREAHRPHRSLPALVPVIADAADLGQAKKGDTRVPEPGQVAHGLRRAARPVDIDPGVEGALDAP